MIAQSLWFRNNEAFMCTSHKAGKDIDFRALFDFDPPLGEWRDEVTAHACHAQEAPTGADRFPTW
jgi:hypothetical protein